MEAAEEFALAWGEYLEALEAGAAELHVAIQQKNRARRALRALLKERA